MLTSVTLEALIIGFLASVVGLIGGLFLARGVNALFKAVNADLPATALNLTTSIVIYSLLLGTLVTLVAGIFPAVRATRVPPIAAVREGATLPASRISKYTPYIALVVVAIAVALLAYGMFGSGMTVIVRLGSLAIGCLMLFVGVALISPRLVPWISAGVRPIAKWLMLGIGYLVYPTRLGAWLVRAGLFRPRALVPVAARDIRRRRPPFARDRPRLALAFAIALQWLSPVLMYLGIVGVIGMEIVLVVWLVVLLVQRVRKRGHPSDRPDVSFDPATDKLAGENSRRAPGRTAATAAALMIGLALVTFISVLANGMKGSNREAIERQVKAQYLVTSTDGFTPFPTAIGDAVAASPEVTDASSVREGLAKLSGSSGDLTGIDPETITQVYTFDWIDGSDQTIRDLSGRGAIVEKQFAEDEDLQVNDTFNLLSADGDETLLTVAGSTRRRPSIRSSGKRASSSRASTSSTSGRRMPSRS